MYSLLTGIITGAAGIIAYNRHYHKAPLSPVVDTSWSELALPDGHHATVVYRGYKSAGVSAKDAMIQHNALVKELSGSAIKLKVADEISWFGQDKTIGVLQLECINQEDYSIMFRHFNAHDLKNHGDQLKLHMTLFSDDNPEDYLGKTIESTTLSTAMGSRERIITNLIKPFRKPIMIKKE